MRSMLSAFLFLLLAVTARSAHAQTFTTLLDFDVSNGAFPGSGLVQGEDGNFYGTTPAGGSDICGTFFKITSGGVMTILHNFSGADGCGPTGLVLATDGNYYGATEDGGVNNLGTIFRVTPNGTLTTLYNFDGTDGADPSAPLIQAAGGDFYGTTDGGGTGTCPGGCGTVFKVSSTGKLTTLHSFTQSDGAFPTGGLLQATDGALYGTTSEGGAKKLGTVFRITESGVFNTLDSFRGSDGEYPYASLVEGMNGNLYGTTTQGGADDAGTIFEVGRSGMLATVHSFDGTDGAAPNALDVATDGNFYGSAAAGGSNSDCGFFGEATCGTLFSFAPNETLTVLHSMDFSDGSNPESGMLQATNGVFYGTAQLGGLSTCDDHAGCGTVFSLDMGLGPFVAFVHPFGKVGQTGGILGQGFTGTTAVSLNGTPMTFNVVSDTYLTATVPPGATTGYVTVTTPTGVLTSNVPFHVIP